MRKPVSSLIYWAISSEATSPGITNKVSGFIKGAQCSGIESTAIIVPPGSYFSYFKSFVEVFRSAKDVVVFRYNNRTGVGILFLTIALRLTRRRVVLDVPTPIVNHLQEILLRDKKNILSVADILNAVFLGPFPFISANLVLQYAREHPFFNPASLVKSILIGNGIDSHAWIDSVIESDDADDAKEIRLIAVGALAPWHGWDRLLRGFAKFREKTERTDILLSIVGDGQERENLENLCKYLQLTEFVEFHGNTVGSKLQNLYKQSHIGIGSLAWDLIGIDIASPLKHREYLANGIPFVYCTDDPDFPEDSAVAYRISPSPESICCFLETLRKKNLPTRKACMEFCLANLDFVNKVPKILDRLG